MALFTGKGDDGTTYFFGSKERFGKDTPLVEALGTLDELGSLLGVIKAQIPMTNDQINRKSQVGANEIEKIQENLFIVQAELAGADKRIDEQKVRDVEKRIGEIEQMLPPIKTFFIAGASSASAWLDYARTIARRAERRVVALEKKPEKWTLAYLNRLSSLLYAFARLAAKESGEVEKAPTYK